VIRKLVVVWVFCLWCALGIEARACASAQDLATAVHPAPPDLAKALETLDVVLAKVHDPLFTVTSALSNADAANAQQRLLHGVQEVSHRWAAILIVSDGHEYPKTSDLFFIYTEILDLKGSIDLAATDPRMDSEPQNVVRAVTTMIRSETDLLHVAETLRYAVADRIDVEETKSLSNAHK
jgi:hypothetical protein